ncbi:MAG: hypothetical protein K8R88_13770 [Armatimonadetes bacterium]|nr:hypothetical protein [Armatimonadota bacterium]
MSRVILFVANVAEVSDFYVRHFGFKALPGASSDWVELAGEGCNLGIHKARGGSSGPDSPAKIVFYCADVPEAKKAFEAQGLKFGKVNEFGEMRFADAADPAGNPIQISNR